jgi:hypothetical protein
MVVCEKVALSVDFISLRLCQEWSTKRKFAFAMHPTVYVAH